MDQRRAAHREPRRFERRALSQWHHQRKSTQGQRDGQTKPSNQHNRPTSRPGFKSNHWPDLPSTRPTKRDH
jgi:hypothetical protein